MITIACIFLITLIWGMVALLVYLSWNHKGKPTSEIKKPTPAPPTSKKSCGNCSSCKCNTTKSSGPR